MADEEIHVGDIGTILEGTVTEDGAAVDISSASVRDITLERPDLTSVTRTGAFTTDGTDGLMYLTSIAGDFSMTGVYSLQAYIELPAWDGYSKIKTFEVHGNLG